MKLIQTLTGKTIPILTGLFLMVLLCLFLIVSLKTNNEITAWAITKSTSVGGPFESSNTASRYALVESIASYGKFSLTKEQAKFGVPDVVYKNNIFYSSFTPGISILAVPFYKAGFSTGLSPITTFGVTILFAMLNGVLLYLIGKKLKSSNTAAILGSATFLLATNALPYSSTLTQHHGSTAVILFAVLIALSQKRWWKNIIFGILCGVGFLFDFPNLFMLFPLGVYLLFRSFDLQEIRDKFIIKFNLSVFWILIAFVPLAGFFGWYNYQLSGSYIDFPQFSVRTNYFDTDEKKELDRIAAEGSHSYQATLPFYTRSQLQGIYILIFSNERSWLYYSPVVWIGVAGLYLLYKKNRTSSLLLLSIICVNVILYSMFGDPWGGWSFGPRYLIPSAALLSVGIGTAATYWNKKILFWLIYLILVIYSVAIVSSATLTTTSIPPKQESQALSEYVPYTYTYNFNLIAKNKVTSLVYQHWFKKRFSGQEFYYLYAGSLIAFFISIAVVTAIFSKKQS